MNSLERTLNPNVASGAQKIDHLEKEELILYRWLLKLHSQFVDLYEHAAQEQPLELQL